MIIENARDIFEITQQVALVEGFIKQLNNNSRNIKLRKIYKNILETLKYALNVRKLDFFSVKGIGNETIEHVYLGVMFIQITDKEKINLYEINGRKFEKLSQIAEYIEKMKNNE
jgi:hypothetical protein